MTTETATAAADDSCPTGITFGEATQITPDEEKVKNTKIATFNNGDYVSLWTEINVNPSRLEFQLFKNDNTKIETSCGISSCTGELVEDLGTSRLGTTNVGVYEDYTFVIAWSTQEHTYAPWVIKVKSFNYDVSKGTYTSGSILYANAHLKNHGIFGFSTLSYDNGFVLSYMESAYRLSTYIYKAKQFSDIAYYTDGLDGTTNQKLPIIKSIVENVKASYKKEIIVKAVPTRYFFSVITSDLMDGRGIHIWNYRIDNSDKVCIKLDKAELCQIGPEAAAACFRYIETNPRNVIATQSFVGGTAIAWQVSSKVLGEQYYPSYKSYLFTAPSEQSQVVDINPRVHLGHTHYYHLEQIYNYDNIYHVAYFISRNEDNPGEDLHSVFVFDKIGKMIQSHSSYAGLISVLGETSGKAFSLQAIDPHGATPVGPSIIGIKQVCSTQQVIATNRGRIPFRVPIGAVEHKLYGSYSYVDTHLLNDKRKELAHKALDLLSTSLQKYIFISNDLEQEIALSSFQYFVRTNGRPFSNIKYKVLGAGIHNLKYIFGECSNENLKIVTTLGSIFICNPFLDLKPEPDLFDRFYTHLGYLIRGIYQSSFEHTKTYTYMTKQECVQLEKFNDLDKHVNCMPYYVESTYHLLKYGEQHLTRYHKFRYFKPVTEGMSIPTIQNIVSKIIISVQLFCKLDQLGKLLVEVSDIDKLYDEYLGNTSIGLIQKIINDMNTILKGSKSTDVDVHREWGGLTWVAGLHLSRCREEGVAGYSTLPPASKIVTLCNGPFWDNDDVTSQIIMHEVSHLAGTSDGPQQDTYGELVCREWAVSKPPSREAYDIAADCLTLFIAYAEPLLPPATEEQTQCAILGNIFSTAE